MYEDIFRRIITASQNNSLTFFVGAGVSRVSGAPSWHELISYLCKEMGRKSKQKYTSDECLQIPQKFYYYVGSDSDRYYSFLDNFFGKKQLEINSVHKLLFKLDPHTIITTNFDNLLETASVKCCQSFKVIACDKEVPTINGDRYILKVHGDFAHRNIVFKEQDYLNYSDNFKLIETILKSIFSMNTVVIIGYGLNDYNIRLILNWAKNLLKEDFQKPIFVYADDEVLRDEDIEYQESKGLIFVDYKNCMTDLRVKIPYEERYAGVLKAIQSFSSTELENKTKEQAFNTLYERLAPLDRLRALRMQDVQWKLQPHIHIDLSGTIYKQPLGHILLEYFLEIDSYTEEQRMNLDAEVLRKYNTIASVFSKARIEYGEKEHEYVVGDQKCITFDYIAMREFCRLAGNSLMARYRKAYYMAKLHQYEDSYKEFSSVVVDAFEQKDMLLYYFAQVNCIYLYIILQNPLHSRLIENFDKIEESALTDSEAERIFDRMPVEFKNMYPCFKDLHSADLLYRYSHYASLDEEKLQNAIERNSKELGFTSYNKAVCRINEYLHFLLGNCIYIDEFAEFRTAVRRLQSQILHKYAQNSKESLYRDLFFGHIHETIVFDELDFYCFIEYFDTEDIPRLFYKYGIKDISFQNMEQIYNSIHNLMLFYELLLAETNRKNEILHFERQIRTCIALMRYMTLSQDMVDIACRFILTREFTEITIDDKIGFLDSQLYNKQKYSAITDELIENSIIGYIDNHLNSLSREGKYKKPYVSRRMEYCNLIHYLSPGKSQNLYRLSLRVAKILTLNDKTMIKDLWQHYVQHLSVYQKRKIAKHTKEMLNGSSTFRFDLFALLVVCEGRINEPTISKLKSFLYDSIDNAKKSQAQGVIIESYPDGEPYEELNEIGYWCRRGWLNKLIFAEFQGISSRFDFFYQYTEFDFERFEVPWLVRWSTPVLKMISKDEKVRTRIRSIISQRINENDLNEADLRNLQKILIQFFC